MSPTIRIAKKDKERLDQLAKYISFHARRRITQEEIMASLIDAGEANKEELCKRLLALDEETVPIDPSDPFFHVPPARMGKSASKDHDKIIYGGQ